MTGCPTDTTENPPPNTPPAGNDKVVAEKYRGKWVNENNSNGYFILSEKTMETSSGLTLSAYTEGNILYSESSGIILKEGMFVTDTRFKQDGFEDIYLK
jgi:hypothetical protein